MSEQTNFLTVEEAAQFVGLSHWTLRSWLHKGRLTKYKSVSRTLVNRSELLELLKPKKSGHGNGRDNCISATPISKNKKLQQR